MTNITHIVVESTEGSNIVRSRHKGESAAAIAASRSKMMLARRYPGGCLVTYRVLEVWYFQDRRNAPKLLDDVEIYSECLDDYALATA